ncbi:SMI1/KNR4 family protein [Agrobacterium sp. SHOUNA12C]|nr:SMI1/KNR4 family protein [Agrobacterium sp. BETTINA12B]MCJ9755191.1 SMI1/KNR4 family protein [Agrobacterium sp. SHOUNA12C]NTG32322.1 SMI1/KNR4 family protein [Rhizobium rhizogenes]NTJ36395.1 SMI1/KNR4 family protein [Rhizobium rhizogenes]
MDMTAFINYLDQGSGTAASADDLKHFEDAIGYTLPEDYRAFLSQCAGGYCKDKLSFNWENGSWAGLMHTIGGLQQDKNYSLLHNRENPKWPMKEPLLWIMNDHGGNPICLWLAGENTGKICFLDHEVAPEEDDWDLEEAASQDWGYVLPLAASFSKFINGLYIK